MSPQDWNLTPGHVEPVKVKHGWCPEPSFRTAQAAVAGAGHTGAERRVSAGLSAGVCAGGGGALPLAVGGGKQRIRQPRRPSGEDGRDTVDHTGQQRSRNSQRS